jgi:hypothetical protein
MASAKVPPIFIEEKSDYEQWKKDIDLWTCFTDLDKEKHGIAVHLSLTGRARQASSELKVDELKSAGGLKQLLLKLDRVFLQDKNWKCFNTYLAFENYRRSSEVSMDIFLSEFDLRHHKLKECGVTLPDAVIACRLLKSCNLSDMHFQLALSTTQNMTFEAMRSTLKKLFSENGGCGGATAEPVPAIKLENDVFYSNRGRKQFRPVTRGERSFNKPTDYQHESER